MQRHAPSDIFLQTYLAQTREREDDFLTQVDLYKARTCLGILYYFAKVGMGDTENFWRIQVEAERSLAAVAAGQGVGSDDRAPAISNILPPSKLFTYLKHGGAHRSKSSEQRLSFSRTHPESNRVQNNWYCRDYRPDRERCEREKREKYERR